jgi:hypothetical protein
MKKISNTFSSIINPPEEPRDEFLKAQAEIISSL